MITLYSGTPGSGKSLHLAKVLMDRIRQGKSPVIGNFPLNLGKIPGKKRGTYLCVSNQRLLPARLKRFSKAYEKHLGRRLKEGELLLVIDEAGEIFDPMDWQRIRKLGWNSFFSQHRKFGYDIILVTQDDRQLARSVRSKLEYEIIHRKVSNSGRFGSIFRFFFGECFVCVRVWYRLRERLDSEYFKARRKYFEIYDTYELFEYEEEETGERAAATSRKPAAPSAAQKPDFQKFREGLLPLLDNSNT